MKEKNIIFLITGLNSGGAERNLLYLCQHFVQNHNVYVVVLKDRSFYSDKFEQIGCPIIYLKLNKLKIIPSINFIKFFLKSNTKDTLLVSWLYHSDLVSVFLKLLKPRIKVYWNVRTAEIGSQYFKFSNFILRFLKVASYVVPLKILYNSARGRKTHEVFGYSKKRGIIVSNIFIMPKRSSKKKYKKLNSKYITLGFLGRNVEQKGIDILMNAFLEISQFHPDLKLILAGFDTQHSGWQTYISDKISLAGKITDLRKFYNKIDIFILPSKFGEGTPNVILEALSFGLPCIATDVGDNALLLANGRGVTIKPNNSTDLANAIEQLILKMGLDDSNIREARQQYVNNQFDKVICIQRYERGIFN